MRPILLKGHTRPLTQVIYNREGDLIFSCGKEGYVTVWYSDNGERLGTYIQDDQRAHNGAVYSIDVNSTTTRLLSAGADSCAKIWDVSTGKCLHSISHKGGMLRCAKYGSGDEYFLVIELQAAGKAQLINVYNSRQIEQEGTARVESQIQVRCGKLVRAAFTSHDELDERIIAVGDDGDIFSFETMTGDPLNRVQAHTKPINDLRLSKDGTTFITASTDTTAKLWDSESLELLRTYKTDRPLNSADMSTLMEHVIVGGGQDASQVTTTAGRTGKFESVLFHKVFENQIGSVKGHFGPINSMAFNPNGRSFFTGGEDGYCRIHYFDPEYFAMAEAE